MSKLKLRRSSKAYALRKRFLRLSSNEQVILRHYKKVIQVLLVKTHLVKNNSDENDHYEYLLKAFVAKYHYAQMEPEHHLPPFRFRSPLVAFSYSCSSISSLICLTMLNFSEISPSLPL